MDRIIFSEDQIINIASHFRFSFRFFVVEGPAAGMALRRAMKEVALKQGLEPDAGFEPAKQQLRRTEESKKDRICRLFLNSDMNVARHILTRIYRATYIKQRLLFSQEDHPART